MIVRHAALATLAVATLAACAGPKPMTMQQQQKASSANCLLGPFVRNADGSLTTEQMQAGIDAAFRAADLNGDGVLSGIEITTVNDARSGSCDSSSLIDWSGTGRIDRQTYGARYETTFGFADRDTDGLVTAVEMANPPPLNRNPDPKAKPTQEGPVDPNSMPGGIPNPTGQTGGGY